MPRKKTDKPKLLVFFGMTAVGKSLLAGKLAKRIGCPYYNTDAVRKALAGVGSDSRQNSRIGQGIYSKEFTRRTYDELVRRTQTDLCSPVATVVVLDGSYGVEAERRNVVEAFSLKADIYFIYCFCDEQIIKDRLEQRAGDEHAISDGRWEVYLMQKKNFNVPVKVEGAELLSLDTDVPVDALVDEVVDFVLLEINS